MIAGAVIGFHVIMTGFRVGAARQKVFSKEFMASKEMSQLQDEHKKVTGEAIAKGGYPDMGNGRYSDKLSYEHYLLLNNAQRAHGNYIEGAGSIIAFTLLAGLFYPRLAASLAAAYVVGREVYTIGYTSKGPSGRMYGAIIFDLALLGLFGTAVYGGAQLAGLIKA